jgi:hypothetical protein
MLVLLIFRAGSPEKYFAKIVTPFLLAYNIIRGNLSQAAIMHNKILL